MPYTNVPRGSSSRAPSLAELAARQHGVARTKHLRAIGLSSSTISKYVRRELLHRRHPGVYTVGHTALSRLGELPAAVFGGGDGSALGHLAAAELWEARRRAVSVIDVLVPRAHRPVNGIRFHEARRLDPRDVTLRYGIPVTTVARMLVDLTDSLHPLDLANVIHEAAFRNRFHLPATRAAMARANGRHTLAVLAQAIDSHLNGSAGFKSRGEKAYFALIKDLPEPLVNVDFGGLEIDFRWPEQRLAVEVDGSGHGRVRTRREDAAVDLALKAGGYEVLRFGYADLQARPAWVLEETRRRLSRH